jgi:hypothetical protein
MLSKLQANAKAFVSTLCSCIETTPPCTTTTETGYTTVASTTIQTLFFTPTVTVDVPDTDTTTYLTTTTLAVVTVTVTVPTTTVTATTYVAKSCARPTCQPGVVANVCNGNAYCSGSASGTNCYCVSNPEGGAYCHNTETGALCNGANCASSSDCAAGQICATNLCCGRNMCLTKDTKNCANVSSPSRLFRRSLTHAQPERARDVPNAFPSPSTHS